MHTYTAPKSTSESQAHKNYLLTYGPGACTGPISEQKYFTRLSCGGIISDHFNLRLRYHKRTLHSSLLKKHSTEACPELSWAHLVTFKADEFTIQHISFSKNANNVTETED